MQLFLLNHERMQIKMDATEVTNLAGADYIGPIVAILIIVLGYVVAKIIRKGGEEKDDKSIPD